MLQSQSKSKRYRNRVQVQMRRIRGEARLISALTPQEVLQVRIVLNDLSGRGVGFFSQKKLEQGAVLEIDCEAPLATKLKGRVIWCHEHNLNSHVLTSNPFMYRAGLQFIFDSPEEEQKLFKLCDDLAKNNPVQIVQPPAPAAAATDPATATAAPADGAPPAVDATTATAVPADGTTPAAPADPAVAASAPVDAAAAPEGGDKPSGEQT
jgi:hypothetical protein